jgi:hypothetical protein
MVNTANYYLRHLCHPLRRLSLLVVHYVVVTFVTHVVYIDVMEGNGNMVR